MKPIQALAICVIAELIMFGVHFNIISGSIPSMGDPIYIGSLVLTSTDFIIAVMSAVTVACPALIFGIVVKYQLFKRSRANMYLLFQDHALIFLILAVAIIAYLFCLTLEFEFASARVRQSNTDVFDSPGKFEGIPEEAVMMTTVIFILGTMLLGMITAHLWHRNSLQH